jgi:hypothetical protein
MVLGSAERRVNVKRTDVFFVISLVLIVIGAASLVYGIIAYNDVTSSLGNALGKLFTGQSAGENQAIAEMIAGAAVALVGFILLFSQGLRRMR